MTDEQMQSGRTLQNRIDYLKGQINDLNSEVKRTVVEEKGIQIKDYYGNGRMVYVSPKLGAVIITLVEAELNESLAQAEEEFAKL